MAREPIRGRPDEPTLVVDGDARPLGWADPARPGQVFALGRDVRPETDTLRVALDSALTSPFGLAVAVDGRPAGTPGGQRRDDPGQVTDARALGRVRLDLRGRGRSRTTAPTRPLRRRDRRGRVGTPSRPSAIEHRAATDAGHRPIREAHHVRRRESPRPGTQPTTQSPRRRHGDADAARPRPDRRDRPAEDTAAVGARPSVGRAARIDADVRPPPAGGRPDGDSTRWTRTGTWLQRNLGEIGEPARSARRALGAPGLLPW